MRKKKAAGFTLVELIVVIAVMGILGAVGTVAYSGYVKSAQKKADMVTVGNIERAIETGTYSHAFQVNDALQLSADGSVVPLKIPVGFIVIGKGGTESLQSGAEAVDVSKECEIVTEIFYHYNQVETALKVFIINAGTRIAYKKGEPVSVTYCKTHSVVPTKMVHTATSTTSCGNTKVTASENPVAVSDCYEFCTFVGGDAESNPTNPIHKSGQKLEQKAIEYQNTNESGDYIPLTTGVLSDILRAAYGNAYGSVTLQSNEWNVSSIPTIMADAGTVIGNLEDMADMLMRETGGSSGTFIEVSGLVNKTQVIKGNYATSEELVQKFAEATAKSSKEQFLTYWRLLDQVRDGKLPNGQEAEYWGVLNSNFNGYREFYGGLRQIYNDSFITYMEKNTDASKHDIEGHAHDIKTHTDEKIQSAASYTGMDVYLPRAVDYTAFAEGGDLSCPECLRAYEEYTSSGASLDNAAAIYDAISTIADNGTKFIDSTGKGLFEWYDNYLEEISNLYDAVDKEVANLGGNCIVISVFQESGELSYDVSPAAADPRKVS